MVTVAWISDFPIEWLPDLPEPLRGLPRPHPATWMSVLLSQFQARPSLRLHVLALRKGISSSLRFERKGVTFHILKVPAGLRAPSLFWLDTLLLRRAVRAIQPDLVHAWGTEKGAALIASRLGYPYLVTIQGLLTWYRTLVPLNAYESSMAWFEHLSLARARTVTAESSFAVQYLKQRYPKLQVQQVEHAPNSVFHEVQRQPLTGDVRIISVGTLCYRKGTDLLLQALDGLTAEASFRAVFVGEPDHRLIEPLRQKLSPELWRRVAFKKELMPAELAKEMATATLSVLPTRADTSPNAVKEAVVAGVPVVASQIGGIPDYVFPGKNGLLFPAGSPSELGHCLRQALAHPLFGQGLVEPATLAMTRSYLSPSQMAERFWGAYQFVLEQNLMPRSRR